MVFFFEGDIRQRIGMLRQAKRLSREAFAASLGIKPSKVQDLERMRYQPEEGLIRQILEIYRPNPDWFLHGIGEMFGESNPADQLHIAERLKQGATAYSTPAKQAEFFKSFGARARQADEMVSEVLADAALKPNRLLFEALKTLAMNAGATHEQLSLLVAGIEEQIKQAEAKGDLAP